MPLPRSAHNKYLHRTTCLASVPLGVLSSFQRVRQHLFVGHTEEHSEARTDGVEASHHAKAQDHSNPKDSSRPSRSMADHLVVAVADLRPVVDKQMASPRRTRTKLQTAATLAVTSEVAQQTSFPVDEEATRAVVASLSSTTLTRRRELFLTTRTFSRETTLTYHRLPI